MATETLVSKKLDVDVPAEEEAVTAEGDEEKAVAAVGDEEKLTSETEEKDVSEEEKDLKVVVEEEQEAVEEGKQTDEEGEPSKKPKASRKRSSKKGGGGELKKSAEKSIQKQPRKRSSSSKEPVTPVDRPARERKSVERYSALSAEKVPASKGLSIEKGRGTQLKDIPNVAFKLSKRKSDENLQMLHTILFGKKAKVHILKRNISQFSGYVWLQNEEKQRTKVKEKIDKFVKEKLLDFCDVLDIPVSKTTAKKEELSAKLLEFLESPHATTEVSLADKEEKGKKRKRKTPAGTKVTAGKASGHGSNKKPKQSPEVTKKQKHISKVEDEDETGSADTRRDPDEGDDSDRVQMEESDEGESESESAEDKTIEHIESVKGPTKNIKSSEAKAATKNTPVKKETPTKSVKASAKSTKGSSASALKKGTAAADRVSASPTKSKASGTKNGSENDKRSGKHSSTSTKDKSTSKKQPNKLGAKISVKEQGAGKASSKKAKAEPNREEMHAVVTDIMKEVDFNTATLSDIIRQLGTHFGMDLMHRKAEVKGIIEEVINSMTDEEDDGADGEDDENSEQAGGEADDRAGGDNDD